MIHLNKILLVENCSGIRQGIHKQMHGPSNSAINRIKSGGPCIQGGPFISGGRSILGRDLGNDGRTKTPERISEKIRTDK